MDFENRSSGLLAAGMSLSGARAVVDMSFAVSIYQLTAMAFSAAGWAVRLNGANDHMHLTAQRAHHGSRDDKVLVF